MNRAPELTARQKELVDAKQAAERIFSSEDGQLVLNYLGKMCLNDLGVPKKDGLAYAYSEGRRGVLLTLMQLTERPLYKMVEEMVKAQEMING